MTPPNQTRPGDARARAAQTKRDRTRRALLDAADAAFASRGWLRTRVEDIATAAGVSAATAYNHFPSKHALMGHVYAPLIRPLIAQAEQDRADDRPVVDALSDQVRALARASWRHRGLTTAFAAAVQDYTIRAGGPPDPDDDQDPRVVAPMPSTILGLIEDGQRDHVLHPFPPALEISGMVINLLLMRSVNRPHEPPERTAELLLTVLFGALRPELLLERGTDGRPFRSGT
ncbi:TetR/AcrR family transcriptional regulator [Pseudonocardia acidicola]|uniref:TetR/AcrR family transcriptional regulator n=1 Tax=Pseudonocardia acidicola TaxID=2724939 RepID=A0ABX1SMV3_9PSEU|nr:TetR/AcrR family transcriptional regulator [Pseudonocardia acidicola]NMI02183.1 TetR/AcrR family transcriptional regulator [Pseudonocardia acidicola]